MYSKLKYWVLFCFPLINLFLGGIKVQAQVDSSSDFGGIVYLDSLVVTASRAGFNAADFIKMVQEDSSFYQAFRNLRFLTYESDNDIRFYAKDGTQIAALNNKIKQYVDGACRTMDVISEKVSGNYYKRKKKRRYYTAKLYEKIFFTEGRICESKQTGNKNRKGLEKHIEDLKVLLFQPGTEVGVPIVGKKTRIFSPELLPYYDYAIQSKKYNSEVNCYVFSAKIKDDYLKRKADKTIIKSLETFFDKSTFAVIARNYHLKYNGAIIDFDVTINIELKKIGGQYIPEFLHYEGFWNVPMKSAERAWFETRFYGFE